METSAPLNWLGTLLSKVEEYWGKRAGKFFILVPLATFVSCCLAVIVWLISKALQSSVGVTLTQIVINTPSRFVWGALCVVFGVVIAYEIVTTLRFRARIKQANADFEHYKEVSSEQLNQIREVLSEADNLVERARGTIRLAERSNNLEPGAGSSAVKDRVMQIISEFEAQANRPLES